MNPSLHGAALDESEIAMNIELNEAASVTLLLARYAGSAGPDTPDEDDDDDDEDSVSRKGDGGDIDPEDEEDSDDDEDDEEDTLWTFCCSADSPWSDFRVTEMWCADGRTVALLRPVERQRITSECRRPGS